MPNSLPLTHQKWCLHPKLALLLIGWLCSLPIWAQYFQRLHQKLVVVDTHNDFLMQVTDSAITAYRNHEFSFDKDLTGKSHIDLDRQKVGGLDVQVFSVFCTGAQKKPYEFALRQIDSLDAVVDRHPNLLVKAKNRSELLSAVRNKKLVAMLGLEGGHMIENDLEKLKTLYQRGVRYMTLTWNNSTSWATSAYDEVNRQLTQKGLTKFGEEVVSTMNQMGMLVDISHVGEQTFWDVMKVTTKPVIASHSSVNSLCNHPRNLKDDQIKAIAKNGGVIQVNFYPLFIDSNFALKEAAFFRLHQSEIDSMTAHQVDEWIIENYLIQKYPQEAQSLRPSLNVLINHIAYIIQLVGVDYVGLGSDFDGINITPETLDDATDFPLITKALIERGYTHSDIKKIMGGNFLRVLKANEKGSCVE